MPKFVLNKIGLRSITSLVIIGVLFYAVSFFILQDQVLTIRFRNSLQKSLKKNGLNIAVENVHWSGWGSFRCSHVSVVDAKQKLTLAQVDQLNLNFDLLSILINRRHFERALRKVELINPSVRLKRYSDGTWNLQRYFPKSDRKLRLGTVFIVKNASLALDDELYGNHNLTQINGKVRFDQGKSVNWECDGVSDFNQKLRWSSRGDAAADFKTGHGEVSAANLLLSEIAPYLPRLDEVRILKGTGKFDLKFGWDHGRIWLINGVATLNDTRLKIPSLNHALDIKELDGWLSPTGFQVNQASIVYNGSSVKLSGRLDTKTAAIKGIVSGERIRLQDLNQFIPKFRQYRIEGLADLKATVSGTLDQPVVDGQISLDGIGIDINKKLRLKRVTGHAKIDRNNINIEKLEGLLDEAKVRAKGEISDIFAPKFDLSLFGKGLNPAKLGLPKIDGLKMSSVMDFKGKISGELWNPLISGEIEIDRLDYEQLAADDLTAVIAWDVASKKVQISKLTGKIGKGSILAEGAIKIDSKGVEWKVSGDLTQIKLGATIFGPRFGIDGQISTHALLKGEWRLGEAFNPGLILGTFKVEGFTSEQGRLDLIQGVYSWEKNKLIVDSIQADAGQGRIYGHLSWDTRILSAGFNAEHISLPDLLADDKKHLFDGIVDGSFEFEGPLSDLSGKIQGSIKQAAYLGKPVGEITCNLEATGRGLKIISLKVASDTGDYFIGGGVDWAEKPMVAVTVSSDNINLAGFRNLLAMDSSLPMEGAGTLRLEFLGPITNPTYTGEIRLEDPSLGNFRMEQGIIELQGDFQEVRLDRMEFNDGISSIVASGKVNRDDLSLMLAGSRIDLDQFGLEYDEKRLQGRLNFEGRLTGNPTAPELTVKITPGTLAFGPFVGDIKSGNVILKDKEIRLSQVKFDGEDFKVNIYGKLDISQPLTVDLAVDLTDLSLAKLLQVFNVSEMKAAGKLGGLVRVTGNPSQPEIRFNGELSDATLSGVPFSGEFVLDYQQNRLSIEQLRLTQASGELVADGIWEAGSRFNLQVKATGFSLETFNSLFPPEHQLAGAIDLDTNLFWSGSKISGEIQAKVDEFYLNQNHFGDLQLQGRFTQQGILIAESVIESKDGSISAKGLLPWPDQILTKMSALNASSQGLHLELVFKDAPLTTVNSYLPQNVKVTSGSLNGTLNMDGAYGWPLFSGELRATHVGVGTPLLPLPVEKTRIFLVIEDNKVFIRRARGQYGDGRFAVNGEMILFGEEDQLHFDLNFNGSNLYYSNNYFDGYSNLNLQLKGTANNSKLSGDINVFESRIGLLKIGKKGSSNLKWNPSFDLKVSTGKNVRYRQVGLADITVRSVLQIKGDLHKPLINGEAVSTKGVLTLYGHTFKINNGKAVFKYSEGFYPYVDIDSSVSTAKAEVFLRVKGQIGGDLAINLYSYPSISEEDLFAMLNWSELRGDKPLSIQGVANTNLSIVTDTMFGEVFYELRQALHLDYLYLEHDYNADEFRISAGDYVSSDLFLSYSRSVKDQPKEKWGLDYHLTSKLTVGGIYSIEDGASWRLTYRFRF